MRVHLVTPDEGLNENTHPAKNVHLTNIRTRDGSSKSLRPQHAWFSVIDSFTNLNNYSFGKSYRLGFLTLLATVSRTPCGSPL
jgi:hypothetical protein